jgi:S-adenosylmethionine:tRNA ribosyltransferase-isomerase
VYSLIDYDYDLPKALIAQQPAPERDRSRLLVLDRKTGGLSHHTFQDLTDLLLPSDVLVVNNTEVVPGRLFGKKASGGKVELLILDYAGKQKNGATPSGRVCGCLIKASKRPGPGTRLLFEQGLSGEVLDFKDGIFTVNFSCDRRFEDLLYEIGHVPLPPYIQRDETTFDDKAAYQTVYASQKGAVAAPTAGLHFSDEILERLRKKGIQVVEITLHVGHGTFLPVRVSDIRQHRMHSEWFHISEEAADTISNAKADGRRVVAVGTTSVRTLEFSADTFGHVGKRSGACDLFIFPGYRFKVVDAMVTNFHLPESTLLMLVSAFAGREQVLNAYKAAISKQYRFYSYGDAMLIA